MTTRTTLGSLAALAAGAVLSASALVPAAQAQTAAACVAWDKTVHDPLGQLFVEGFLVAQEGAAGVEAFSSSARKWTTVSPPGSSVAGSGDWCLLVKEPQGLRAYSARLNNSAFLPPSFQPVFFDSHDDVALAVTFDPFSGAFTAWGYSAVHGSWIPQPLGAQVGPADYAISRFVVGVRDGADYHGFSARTGGWQTLTAQPGAPLAADGNTLIATFTDPTGAAVRVAAFSGVRGCWATSPTSAPGSPVLLDHNTAYVRADVGSSTSFAPCAYSAYRASWSTSPMVQPVPTAFEQISDNVVTVENGLPGFGVDGFGAGGGGWVFQPGPVRVIVIDEDYAIAVEQNTLDLFGFSGLCTGPWQFQTNLTGVFPTPITPPDHIGGVTIGQAVLVYQPALNVWAPPLPLTPVDVVLAADAVIEVVNPGVAHAIAARWANWIPNPPVSLATAGTGSVIAHQGPGGVIDTYDERCDMWNPPALFGAPTLMTAGRNLVVFSPAPGSVAGGVRTYSVQRGDWTSPGALAFPLAVGPIAEENVATLVDGGGVLWAYGSVNDGHVYYQWPNGTEYHVSGGVTSTVACKPTLFGYGIRSKPGDLSWALLGTNIQCPPVPVAGIGGQLWMPLLTTSIYSFVGVHDLDCMVELKLPLASTLPGCIQPWFQPLTIDPATFAVTFGCRRSDAAWIY